MSELPEDLFFNNNPPSNVAGSMFQVQAFVTGAAAAAFNWTTALTGASQVKGRVHMALEAVTTDCFVRFGPATSTGTTANNGRLIKAGSPAITFFVSPTTHQFIDAIAPAGAGVLKVQVVSPIGAREFI